MSQLSLSIHYLDLQTCSKCPYTLFMVKCNDSWVDWWGCIVTGKVCRGPVSVLGRARSRTLRNVYGVGSPTVGPTSSSVRRHIYVPSHKMKSHFTLRYLMNLFWHVLVYWRYRFIGKLYRWGCVNKCPLYWPYIRTIDQCLSEKYTIHVYSWKRLRRHYQVIPVTE